MEIDEQEQINQLNEENEYELEVQPDERLEAETFAETQVDKKNMAVSLLQNMTLPEQDKAVAVKQGTKLRENTGSEEDSVSYRMLHWKFSPEQKKELKRALDMRLPKKYILSYAYPENSVIKMMQYRKEYEKKTDIS
jgi:type IV secretion system protein VirD4